MKDQGLYESQSSLASATGNPEHYITAMIDSVPKFDPTSLPGLAITMTPHNKAKAEVREKKSDSSFQFGGHVSYTNSKSSSLT